MTTTIGVTFNSGDRGNLKGEEKEERLEIGDDEILTIHDSEKDFGHALLIPDIGTLELECLSRMRRCEHRG